MTERCDWSGCERTREPVGDPSKAASGGSVHLQLSGPPVRWWPVSTGSFAESWNRRLVWLARILVQPRCGCGRRLGKALGAGVSRGPLLRVQGNGRPGRLLGSAVHFLIAAGNRPLALGLLEGFSDSPLLELRQVAHGLYLQAGELQLAQQIEGSLEAGGRTPATTLQRLLIDRRMAEGDITSALAVIESGELEVDPCRYVTILKQLGKPAAVLGYLDSQVPRWDPVAEALARFDALWSLGQPEAALDVLEPLIAERFGVVEVIRRVRDAYLELGVDLEVLVENVSLSARADGVELDALLVTLFELGRVNEVVSVGTPRMDDGFLGLVGTYHLARAHYVLRNFEATRATLTGVVNSRLIWDAEKLESRILLEEGRFREALEHRLSRKRLQVHFDEVEYFALLHLGRYFQAFSLYAHTGDARRLRSEFGAKADESLSDSVESRFLIPQNGPGDEILHAATYAQLSTKSEYLSAACDPRLESLFTRSFPNIKFVASERLAGRPGPGFLAPGRVPRAPNALYDLLTAEAYEVAQSCQRVALGRNLPRLSIDDSPYRPYLTPEPATVERLRPRIPSNAIGVVWRSELADPMRSIHYVGARDLVDLVELGRPMVNLQHDISATERSDLGAMFGDRMVFLDDLDLRDDFEVMAAVAALCESVVGAGTTALELSAAVGTPTIALQPNLIGSWRQRPNGVGDYWHGSMRVAVSDDINDRRGCVRQAQSLLKSNRSV